ncbi:MAG: nitrate reductase cytochrome c-type subunit [Candidatus Accumulibacter sp.]|jgi:cytochrome c-type protein NapB|nr:nitrate reductase cytochrome c-type subunit [Accumulibacter sp.]
MKSRLLTAVLAAFLLLPGISSASEDGGLATLRGVAISTTDVATNDALKPPIETEPLDRDFTEQPPLVTHAVEQYPINKSFNKCLDCHSWENARKEKATKVSSTHFEDAQGNRLVTISARRYFCLQCHVPQVDAKPLIANTYQRPTAAR